MTGGSAVGVRTVSLSDMVNLAAASGQWEGFRDSFSCEHLSSRTYDGLARLVQLSDAEQSVLASAVILSSSC
jgi:hypothetical protein